MGYYDNVKDNVKDKGGSEDTPNFDTLKEKAEETSEQEDEEKGDDTPIEVLEDGGLSKESPSKQQSSQTADSSTANQSSSGQQGASSQQSSSGQQSNASPGSNSFTQAAQDTGQSQESASDRSMENVEQKLDRIIEQNQRMIEILESFGS